MTTAEAVLKDLQTYTAKRYYAVTVELIAMMYPDIQDAERLERFKQDCWDRGMVVAEEEARFVLVRAMDFPERFITGRNQ